MKIFLSLVGAVVMGSLAVSAGTLTWDGSTSNLWSGFGNFSGTATAPFNDDEIVFPAAGANKSMVNNLGFGLDVGRLNFSGSGYALSGDRIDLSSTVGAPVVRTTHTSGTTSANVPLLLVEPSTFSSVTGSTLAFLASGDVALGINTLTLDADGTIDFGGSISGSGGVTMVGGGTVRYDAAQSYAGFTTLSAGQLIVTSTLASSVTGSSGTVVQGTGTLAGITTSGQVMPGDNARGRLTVTGVFAFTSSVGDKLVMELGANTTPGTTYDQLQCQGTVTLQAASTALTLSQATGFAPSVGQVYTLIDKISAGAISGRFQNVSQGGFLTLGTKRLQFSYTGGVGGNDLVATVTNTLPTISAIANQTINEDAATGALAFTVGDTETAAGSLTVSGSSSNTTLIPNANIVFGGSGSSRTVIITPAANQSGSATITVTVSDGTDSVPETLVLTVNGQNDTPTISDIANQSLNADSATAALPFTIGDIETAAGSLVVSGSSSNTTLVPNANIVFGGAGASRTVTVTPAAGQSGTATITVTVSDGTLSAQDNFTLTVNGRPTISNILNQVTTEDTALSGLAFTVGDPETAAGSLTVSGMSSNTTLVPNSNIVFGGSGANRTVTVTPAPDQNSSVTITVTVSDGTLTASAIFNLTISAVNDAPSFAKGTNQTVLEDAGAQTVASWVTLSGLGPSDESSQTWTYEITSNSNPSLFAVAPAVTSAPVGDGALSYTPAANASGTATIGVRVVDSGGTANGGVNASPSQNFTITVNSVNDAPSYTKGPNQSVLEDPGAQFVTGWATSLSSGASNESAQTLVFEILSNSNAPLFSAGPVVGSNGTLTYTPAANANGSATVQVRIKDNGGTANGGVDASASQSFTITVTSVNDRPSFTKGPNQTLTEDAPAQVVPGWATAIIAGPAEEAGQTLSFEITINNNPTLFAVGPVVSANGTLTFTPAPNAVGTANIVLGLRDNGGVANGGTDFSFTETFTIILTAVNDAPSFVKGPNITSNEDPGSQSFPNWAASITNGGGDEFAQTLTFEIAANSNSALFATQPAVSTAGTLTFLPAANVSGSATIDVRLKDNGGTAGGGADTSPIQTFTITVIPVNDAPSFTRGPNLTVDEDSGGQLLAGWATVLNSGAPDETGQSLSFQITGNSNSALFAVAPVVSPDGSLSYTPATNANGSATINLRIADNGGTANGGINASVSQSFIINVTSVNDLPSFVQGGNITVHEDAGLQTIPNWATGITPGAPNESSSGMSFIVVGVSGNLPFTNGAAVNATTGDLTFRTFANSVGTAVLRVRLVDSDGAESPSQEFQITATPVNDPPVFFVGPNQVGSESSSPRTVAGWATGMTSGPADESSQMRTFEVVTNTNPSLFSTSPAVSSAGTLSYTIGAGLNGSAVIGLRLRDNGGTANGGVDVSSVQNFIIDIISSNSQPTFTGGPNQVVNEDAGSQSIPNWATNISQGPPDESGQTITFEVTFNTVPGLFSVQPAVSPAGTLTFTPAPNVFGSTNLSVRARDNGGTSLGIDTSPSHAFTITVNAVNDPPVAVAQNLSVPRDVVLPVTLSASDFEGNPVVLSVVTLPAHGTLTGTAPNLTYVPDSGYTGPDSFTYRGTDADPGPPATITITVTAPPVATGVTRVWDGGAGNEFWSQPANWVGDLAPQQGDSLQFPAGATGVGFTVNDFPALSIFNVVRPETTQIISGNRLVLLGGVECSGSVNWSIPMDFSQPGSIRTSSTSPSGFLTISADIGVGPHPLTLEGATNGPGSVAPLKLFQRVFGSGRVVSRGAVFWKNQSAVAGAITGGVTVDTGTLTVSRSGSQRALASGPLEVKGGAVLAVHPTFQPFDASSSLLVRPSGSVRVVNFGGASQLKVSTVELQEASIGVDSLCSMHISGNLAVSGITPSFIGIGSPSAALVFTSPSHTIDVPTGSRLAINAIGGTFATGTIHKIGAGTLDLNGRTDFDGGLSVDAGDVRFFADTNIGSFGLDAQETVVTLNGGNVSGQSYPSPPLPRRTGPIVSAAGGVIKADPEFCELRTRDLNLNAATTCKFDFLDVRITSSRRYDTMLAQGGVNLGGAALDFTLLPGSVIPAGETLVFLDNDGSDPIQGAFAGLPEGAVRTIGNVTIQITYQGGDGNDVALKFGVNSTGITRVWNGGGNSNNWTDPGNWVGNVAPQLGDSLAFPSPSLRHTPFNDYPPDTAFHHLSVSGNGPTYNINGNHIRLSGGLASSDSNDDFHARDVILFHVICFADQSITRTGTRELVLGIWNTLGHALAVTDLLANPPVQTDTVGIQIHLAGTGQVSVEGEGSVLVKDGLPIHSGLLQHRSGTLVLAQPGSFANQRTGPLTVGGFSSSATVLTFGVQPHRATNATTLAAGGSWICRKIPNASFGSQSFDNLTFAGGSLVADPGASILFRDDVIVTPGTASSFSGELRIAEVTGGPVDLNIGSDAKLTISGASTIVNSVSGSFLRKLGPGTLAMEASMTCPHFDAVGGLSRFDGTAANTLIRLEGGTLGGNGSVGGVTSLSSGTVAPGTGPGILSTGAIAWNAATTVAIEIAGKVAGAGHDQIAVIGPIDLNGATLAVATPGGFQPSGPTVWMIMDNDGADAVTGTFAGLPEGGTVAVGRSTCSISYNGGDGNDVILTASGALSSPGVANIVITPAGSGGGSANATFTASLKGTPNATVRLEASSDLEIWTVIATTALDVNGAGAFSNVTDPGTGNDPAALERRFYRLSENP